MTATSFVYWCGKKHFSSTELILLLLSLSCVRLLVTPWMTARWASLSFTISQSLFKSMSVELVMPSNPLILCRPLLLPSIFPSIRVFSSELLLCIRWPKYSASALVLPMNIQGWLLFRIDWFDLLAVQGTLKPSPEAQFKSINSSLLSLLNGPTLTSVHDWILKTTKNVYTNDTIWDQGLEKWPLSDSGDPGNSLWPNLSQYCTYYNKFHFPEHQVSSGSVSNFLGNISYPLPVSMWLLEWMAVNLFEERLGIIFLHACPLAWFCRVFPPEDFSQYVSDLQKAQVKKLGKNWKYFIGRGPQPSLLNSFDFMDWVIPL